MADHLKLSVPGKPDYLGVVRLAVASAANAAGFSMEAVDDITIAVTEVCEHVFCSENQSTYEVSCDMDESGMTISIDETGRDSREIESMKPCFCLPMRRFIPPRYDPSAYMIMLRALMDEVNIFSCREGDDVLVRMIKLLK